MCNANSLKLNFLTTFAKFSKTFFQQLLVLLLSDTQNFCHSHNVCALKILQCAIITATELATHVAMLLCCWY